jgi:hypothetical protein
METAAPCRFLATVYAELKKTRRECTAGPTEPRAFGDPRYPVSDRAKTQLNSGAELRAAIEVGLTFPRLPFSRQEVDV